MAYKLFIPMWGMLVSGVLVVWLFAAVFVLKRRVQALEARAGEIEELQEARQKRGVA